jgi:hypothetical protein
VCADDKKNTIWRCEQNYLKMVKTFPDDKWSKKSAAGFLIFFSVSRKTTFTFQALYTTYLYVVCHSDYYVVFWLLTYNVIIDLIDIHVKMTGYFVKLLKQLETTKSSYDSLQATDCIWGLDQRSGKLTENWIHIAR